MKTLIDQQAQGIQTFKFVDDGASSLGWSLSDDSRLVQWNLKNGIAVKYDTALENFPETPG